VNLVDAPLGADDAAPELGLGGFDLPPERGADLLDPAPQLVVDDPAQHPG
jgi:hypothetical protein